MCHLLSSPKTAHLLQDHSYDLIRKEENE